MRGQIELLKKDQYGAVLAEAEFTVFGYNPVSKAYDLAVTEASMTGANGIVRFSDLLPGRYELRETQVPAGYSGSGKSYRFIVPASPTESMSGPNYEFGETSVIQRFTYEAVNLKLSIDFVKRDPIATQVSEDEANLLLLSYPGSVKQANGKYFDVYRPLPGVSFDFFRVTDVADIKLNAEALITNEEGKLTFFENFVPDPDATYKLVETSTAGDEWLINTKPLIFRMMDFINQAGFNGVIGLKMDNFRKQGDILISKYDRYNRDRLAGVTFSLYEGTLAELNIVDGLPTDTPYRTLVTDENGFAHFRNLPLGEYVIVEMATLTEQGYFLFEEPTEVSIGPDTTHFFSSIYNMQERDYFEIPIEKIWRGAPHESVTINLFVNGQSEALDSIALDGIIDDKELEAWKYIFKRLLKFDENQQPYIYTLEEVLPEGYRLIRTGTVSADGSGQILDANGQPIELITFENFELMDLRVEKIWEDQDDYYGLRPDVLELQLQRRIAGGEFSNLGTTVSVMADAAGEWSHLFTDLDVSNEAGIAYEYRVIEVLAEGTVAIPGYQEPTYETTAEGVLQIINRLDTTSVSVRKLWDDNDDAFGLRPDSVLISLLQGRKNADGSYTYSDMGVTYQVELQPDAAGLWPVYTWSNLAKSDETGEAFAYKVVETPALAYEEPVYSTATDGTLEITNTVASTAVEVEKLWDDFEDAYGLRPQTIRLQLMQGLEPYGDVIELAPDTSGNWTYRWENLPQFDKSGSAHAYSVQEEKVNAYLSATSDTTATGVIQLNNVLDTRSFSIRKHWDDQENRYALRPAAIELQLLQNGANFGAVVVLEPDSSGVWPTHVWSDLPQSDANGKDYLYSIEETAIPQYSEPVYQETIDGLVLSNPLLTTNFEVTKRWEDQENKYGLRPDSIKLQLQQNGSDFGNLVTLEADNNGNWPTYLWSGLPKVDAGGKDYEYSVVEVPVPHYSQPESLKTAAGVELINTLPTTNFEVSKRWDDQENKYGLRPSSIELQLQQNGEVFGDSVTLEADSNGEWPTFLWSDLPKVDAEGKDYEYSVVEVPVPHYSQPESLKTAAGVALINTLPTTNFEVSKRWDDQENKYGLRPSSIELQLQQNGSDFGDPVTLEAGTNGEWPTYLWSGLPKVDAGGKDYEYSVVESAVPHYGNPIVTVTPEGLSLNNPLLTTDVTITKIWDDDNDSTGNRPHAIQLQLIQNGSPIGDKVSVTANPEGEWQHSWQGLPRIDANGVPYEYRVIEDSIEFYDVAYSDDGKTLLNKLRPTETSTTTSKPSESSTSTSTTTETSATTATGTTASTTTSTEPTTSTSTVPTSASKASTAPEQIPRTGEQDTVPWFAIALFMTLGATVLILKKRRAR